LLAFPSSSELLSAGLRKTHRNKFAFTGYLVDGGRRLKLGDLRRKSIHTRTLFEDGLRETHHNKFAFTGYLVDGARRLKLGNFEKKK